MVNTFLLPIWQTTVIIVNTTTLRIKYEIILLQYKMTLLCLCFRSIFRTY